MKWLHLKRPTCQCTGSVVKADARLPVTAPNSAHRSCSHPDSVGGWLDGSCHPGRWMVLARAILYQAPARTSHIPLQIAGADSGIGMGAFGGSVYSTGLIIAASLKTRLLDRVFLRREHAVQWGGGWAVGEAGRWNMSIHSLVRREVLTVTGCSLVRELCSLSIIAVLLESIWYLLPSIIGSKTQGALFPFAVCARMPSPCLPGLLKCQTQMAALPGRFQGLESV